MKKAFPLIILFAVLSMIAQAQIILIPKAGITINRFATSEVVYQGNPQTTQDYAAVKGLMTGAGIELSLSKSGFLSLQPELIFIQKGYRLETSQSQLYYEGEETHNYIELPLLARFNFGEEPFKVFILIGPSISYLIGGNYYSEARQSGATNRTKGKLRFGQEPANYSGNDYYYTSKEARRADVGLQVGAGIGISLGPGILQPELRYGRGFIDFFDDSKLNITNFNTQNRTIVFALGYGIPLK